MRANYKPQTVPDLKAPVLEHRATGSYSCVQCSDRGLIRIVAQRPAPAPSTGLSAVELLTQYLPCACKMGDFMGATGKTMAAEWAKPITDREGRVVVPSLPTGWLAL